MSIQIQHPKPKSVTTQKEIEKWSQYQELKKFLIRFETTSPNEALSNANELKTLLEDIYESITIEHLKTNAFKARFNVLNNEVLRLYDMTFIPSITAKEVNAQIAKINLLYSSLNTKINTIYLQRKLDNEINLDNFIKLDPTEKRKSNFVKKSKPIKPYRLQPDKLEKFQNLDKLKNQ